MTPNAPTEREPGGWEYRVLQYVESRQVWCVVAYVENLDRALDMAGGGKNRRLEECTWREVVT